MTDPLNLVTPLPVDFYARATLEVARDLLGCIIVRGPVRLRIVETEGYLPGDSACHAWKGLTPRTSTLFGPPGRAYVYLCYGIHRLLNFVTETEGTPGAVLVRGCEVVAGHDVVRARRGGRIDCIGPGKVGQALALDEPPKGRKAWSGAPLDGELCVLPGLAPAQVEVGPRVGIDYALPEHRLAPWRFRAAEPRAGSARRGAK